LLAVMGLTGLGSVRRMQSATRRLVVFLSSVRRGLEQERDNLPALIRAIGHECKRFEDYTAQPVPSRQACLRGADQADVYLLLLGGRYGEPVFDSGLSPTEEEFTRARQRGIPMLVFVKQGVDVEPRQQAFIDRVQEYTGGRFRAGFTSAVDLQPKVAAALTELAAQQAPLVYTPLPATANLTVPWVYDPATRSGTWTSHGAILECHALPLAAPRLAAVSLDALADRLAELGRLHRLFRTDQALQVASDPEGVAVRSSDGRQPGAGLAVRRNRTASVWSELERDMLGHIVEAADLAKRTASMLRLAAEVVPADSDVALAAGLGPTDQIVEGRVSDLGRRTHAAFGSGFGRQMPARAEPEDSVPAATLRSASEEIGQELAARVLRLFRASRR
jgi:Domain of unknown function (DUF4062)